MLTRFNDMMWRTALFGVLGATLAALAWLVGRAPLKSSNGDVVHAPASPPALPAFGLPGNSPVLAAPEPVQHSWFAPDYGPEALRIIEAVADEPDPATIDEGMQLADHLTQLAETLRADPAQVPLPSN